MILKMAHRESNRHFTDIITHIYTYYILRKSIHLFALVCQNDVKWESKWRYPRLNDFAVLESWYFS